MDRAVEAEVVALGGGSHPGGRHPAFHRFIDEWLDDEEHH
jgi:hypothetical protein